jgi:hypothetical protein
MFNTITVWSYVSISHGNEHTQENSGEKTTSTPRDTVAKCIGFV